MAGLQITGPAAPSVVTTQNKTTPTITSLTLGLAGVESVLTFAAGTVAFKIRAADFAKLKLATTSGSTATDDRFDVPPGNTYVEDNFTGSAITYYISATVDNIVVQILTWT